MINPKIALSGEILKENYYLSSPFPNIVLSDFLDPTVLSMCEYESKNISNNLLQGVSPLLISALHFSGSRNWAFWNLNKYANAND